MQIKLEGIELQLGEGCEFELPNYMTRILPEDLPKEINDKSQIIIAAGTDPSDGKITIVTLAGQVLIFDARGFYIPDGPAVPANGGTSVFLKNINNRWPGDSPGFSVDSKWIIEKSTSALNDAVLHTNYIHENNDK